MHMCNLCMYMYIQLWICACRCICVCVRAGVRRYARVYVCVYIYTHMKHGKISEGRAAHGTIRRVCLMYLAQLFF